MVTLGIINFSATSEHIYHTITGSCWQLLFMVQLVIGPASERPLQQTVCVFVTSIAAGQVNSSRMFFSKVRPYMSAVTGVTNFATFDYKFLTRRNNFDTVFAL